MVSIYKSINTSVLLLETHKKCENFSYKINTYVISVNNIGLQIDCKLAYN